MADHLHGLCKNCLPNGSQIFTVSRREDECARCKEGEPTIIIEQQSFVMAICTRCYLKQQSSPPKKSVLSQYHNNTNSNSSKIQYYAMLNKTQILNRSGFFSSEGKMLKKIQKYISKWESIDDSFIKEMNKRAIISSAFTFQKIANKCDKMGSIVCILIGSKTIFGWYHYEGCKIGEKGFQDNESGIFMSNRQPIQLQYYKSTHQCLVAYNPQTLSVILGKPQFCQITFDQKGECKVKCDLVPFGTQWMYQYILKL